MKNKPRPLQALNYKTQDKGPLS